MTDSNVNVSGSDQVYSIDAYEMGTGGDFRQVIVLGDFNTSGDSGCVSVTGNALNVSSIGTSETALTNIQNEVENTNNNTANVLTYERNVHASNPQGLIVQTGSGGLETNIIPGTEYLSTVYLDYDAAGDNPTTNTEVIAAPGIGYKIVLYGLQLIVQANGATDSGTWGLTDGNYALSTVKFAGLILGKVSAPYSMNFAFGVDLTENTALKISSVEVTGDIFLAGVVFYRIEAA
ncbi:hypothetical protein HOE37_06650 [Candidatus Woesearchaeota archaeon]|jgi:hypothetical protein|nr:hypothetical protein [Candidatus Woesearchaeota archaeon]